jgi:multidrug resistance efflux pump
MDSAKILKGKVEKKKGFLILAAVAIVVAGAVGFSYWKAVKDQIYVEKGEISAPTIALSSATSGTLKDVFVKEGDVITADTVVARVGDEMVKSLTAGLVIKTENNIGENFLAGETVVAIINPAELHVEGTVEEDKGLADIKVGQNAVFTVDAFGSKTYQGVVTEVSPSSKDKGLSFSISDKRAVNDFIIKVRFDQKAYPELKNGMSAKIWVYKK